MAEHVVRAINAPDVRRRSVVTCSCHWQAAADTLSDALDQHTRHVEAASALLAQLDPPSPRELAAIAAERAASELSELTATMDRTARTFFGGVLPREIEHALELTRRGESAPVFPADELAARRSRPRRRVLR